MPRFGGEGTWKQSCVKRQCLKPIKKEKNLTKVPTCTNKPLKSVKKERLLCKSENVNPSGFPNSKVRKASVNQLKQSNNGHRVVSLMKTKSDPFKDPLDADTGNMSSGLFDSSNSLSAFDVFNFTPGDIPSSGALQTSCTSKQISTCTATFSNFLATNRSDQGAVGDTCFKFPLIQTKPSRIHSSSPLCASTTGTHDQIDDTPKLKLQARKSIGPCKAATPLNSNVACIELAKNLNFEESPVVFPKDKISRNLQPSLPLNADTNGTVVKSADFYGTPSSDQCYSASKKSPACNNPKVRIIDLANKV